MLELIIFMGIPASGKSTFYRQYFADTHIHISKDLLRNNKQPARRQLILLEEALQQERSVVIDNTNASLKERAPLIALAHQYNAMVIGYYFAAQPGVSLERNKQRTGSARVPDIAIFATLKRLARPSRQEGFDRLYYVQSGERENDTSPFPFIINDWIEESKSDG